MLDEFQTPGTAAGPLLSENFVCFVYGSFVSTRYLYVLIRYLVYATR